MKIQPSDHALSEQNWLDLFREKYHQLPLLIAGHSSPIITTTFI